MDRASPASADGGLLAKLNVCIVLVQKKGEQGIPSMKKKRLLGT